MSEQVTMSHTLRDRLLEWAQVEGLATGDRFLSEAEVVERWQVGRSTAREALKLLEHDGVLVVERGRGRFLSAGATLSVERPISTFESVTHLLDSLGLGDAVTTVLSATEGPADDTEAYALRIEPETPVVRLERLRTRGEDPLLFTIEVFPRHLLPGPIKHVNWSGSLTDLLAAHGHVLESSAARLEAVELPERVERDYALGSLGPWLLITENVLDAAGARVLFAQDFHRGSYFAFNVARR